MTGKNCFLLVGLSVYQYLFLVLKYETCILRACYFFSARVRLDYMSTVSYQGMILVPHLLALHLVGWFHLLCCYKQQEQQ